jgi:hypothetical protein
VVLSRGEVVARGDAAAAEDESVKAILSV